MCVHVCHVQHAGCATWYESPGIDDRSPALHGGPHGLHACTRIARAEYDKPWWWAQPQPWPSTAAI